MRALLLVLLFATSHAQANSLDENTLGRLKDLKTDEEIGNTLAYITGVANAWTYTRMSSGFQKLRRAGTADRAALILSTNLVRECTAHLDGLALFTLAARDANIDPDASLTAFVLDTLETEFQRCISENAEP